MEFIIVYGTRSSGGRPSKSGTRITKAAEWRGYNRRVTEKENNLYIGILSRSIPTSWSGQTTVNRQLSW